MNKSEQLRQKTKISLEDDLYLGNEHAVPFDLTKANEVPPINYFSFFNNQ